MINNWNVDLCIYNCSFNIVDFKLSPCCGYNIQSSVLFPGVWGLKADVSEPSVSSIFKGASVNDDRVWRQSLYKEREES
jgi:hypothetical protein